jgi:hypothetical protein
LQGPLSVDCYAIACRATHAKELQKLPMVPKPAQVTRFCQSGQGIDRADAQDRFEKVIAGIIFA